MARELRIYTDYDVALRYKRKMERSFLINFSLAAAIILLSRYLNISKIPFYVVSSIFLLIAGLSYYSRNSLLKDAEAGLMVFRFTTEGWYRDEGSVLYRWEDFKRVDFHDRAITFYEAKQHKIHSTTISPMLMTDVDFDKAEQWIRQYLPSHMRSLLCNNWD